MRTLTGLAAGETIDYVVGGRGEFALNLGDPYVAGSGGVGGGGNGGLGAIGMGGGGGGASYVSGASIAGVFAAGGGGGGSHGRYGYAGHGQGGQASGAGGAGGAGSDGHFNSGSYGGGGGGGGGAGIPGGLGGAGGVGDSNTIPPGSDGAAGDAGGSIAGVTACAGTAYSGQSGSPGLGGESGGAHVLPAPSGIPGRGGNSDVEYFHPDFLSGAGLVRFTFDTTAPETTITASPAALAADGNAMFTFTGTDDFQVTGYECSLDGAAFAACTSPRSYAGLAVGTHTFAVRAADIAGHVDPTPATYSWLFDVAAPDTTITDAPLSGTPNTHASFSFTGTDDVAVVGYECRLDGAAFAACTSPQSYAGLAVGTHTFAVRAADSAGHIDPTPATYSWLVDVATPDTTITDAPLSGTPNTHASFSFTGTDDVAVVGYECRLDGAAFAACTSPKSYAGLAVGTHTFAVRAADIAGHVDPTPATYSWLVDVAAPDTTITDAPLSGTPNTHASFSFTGTDDVAVVGYECRLDGAAFAACTSPKSYAGLAVGTHTFAVRAADIAGHVDPTPATYSWLVDVAAPDTTITDAPLSGTPNTHASFSFMGTDDVAVVGYECRLDGAAFAACTSPQSYAGLALGTHTFAVRAADIAGHVDPTPATYSWLVDVAAPDTTITDAPLSGTPNTHASFSFTGTDDVAVVGYECRLDGAPFSACTSPMTYAGLAAAPHVFEVRAVDGAGQVDPTPASYAWSVTKPAPIPTLSQRGLILMSLMAGGMGMLMAYRRS